MSIDYAARPPAQIRRTDRAVTDDGWMIDFLHRAALGHLATVGTGEQADQPFINSNLFAYDAAAHVIYLHTARTGRTRANVETEATPARVCFTAAEMGRLLPTAEALEFSVEYSGVVVFGSAAIVADAAEQEHGLQLLMDKYFPHLKPGHDYRPIAPEELTRTSVYRITIDSWSGKRKQVEADFPGAFTYPHTGTTAEQQANT